MPYGYAPSAGVPVGGIILWSGAIVDIPAGWALCDGGGDPARPDLRDKFVVGAGTTYDPGAAGGATSHAHVLTAEGDSGPRESAGDENYILVNESDHLPPYYALAYIIRVV
jgi:hypothetical protein